MFKHYLTTALRHFARHKLITAIWPRRKRSRARRSSGCGVWWARTAPKSLGIVWPLAFVVMRGYLTIFTQRVGLTIAPFLLSLTITLLIAWISVLAQATRAARLKPASVLRYE